MPETDYLTVTRAAYDTVAPDYARLLADALDRMPWDRAALATFVELVSRDRLGPVADVGCGLLEQQLHAAGLPVHARVVRAPGDPETVPQAYLLARKRSAAPSRPPLSGRRRRQRAALGIDYRTDVRRCGRMADVPDLAGPAVPVGRLRDQTQPTLFVDELTLRPWQAADASAVVRAYQDPDIQRWHVRTMSEREAAEWVASWPRKWAEETGAGWAVCDDEGLLARMGLRALSLAEGLGEVAYWVLPEARGRSVAPRALRVVSAWLFVHAGLHRLELAHSTLNTRSCRVAIKAGYALEGTKRQQALHQDGWHDMHLHARVQGDTTSGGSV